MLSPDSNNMGVCVISVKWVGFMIIISGNSFCGLKIEHAYSCFLLDFIPL